MNTKSGNTLQDPPARATKLRRLPAAIAFGAMLAATSSAQAQAAPPGASGMVDPLVGAWNVLVDVYDCNTGNPIATGGQALALFNADGTRHETNATNPALRTPGYGHWTRVDKGAYEFVFKFYRFNASGVHIGSTVIRQDLFLSADESSYYSEGPAEFLNPADGLLFVACSEATATRFE